ncbi:hypothetical protein AV530_015184 [Patagioenas fasciata monilis]|uniref:Uncharacterized protein n=1 Tax=Patagioenas fasciata monilis TaxID=372326 RepID=A0A1V4K1H4_PATFA|nr:hypothetical protein AV530_015184 [Patagioenas fasciata monilis]
MEICETITPMDTHRTGTPMDMDTCGTSTPVDTDTRGTGTSEDTDICGTVTSMITDTHRTGTPVDTDMSGTTCPSTLRLSGPGTYRSWEPWDTPQCHGAWGAVGGPAATAGGHLAQGDVGMVPSTTKNCPGDKKKPTSDFAAVGPPDVLR